MDKKNKLNFIGELRLFNILRMMSGVCSLFIFPDLAYKTLFSEVPKIQVPLFDFSVFYYPQFISLTKILFAIALFLFIIGYKVQYFGILAAVTKFLIMVALPDNVRSFSYLFPFGWLAFSAIEYGKNKNINSRHLETPLALFITSIFLAATLHKLFHFELMKNFLGFGLSLFTRHELRPFIPEFCPRLDCGLVKILLYSVVPYELFLSLFFAIRKFRIYGLILALPFHLFLSSFWLLLPVSFLCLIFESCILLLRYDLKISDFKTFRYNKLFLIGLLAAILTYLSFLNATSLYGIAISLLARSIVALYLFIYLTAFFVLNRHLEPIASEKRQNAFWVPLNLILATIYLLFALSPWLIDNYKSTAVWGWTAFSGAETKWPVQKVRLKLTRCSEIPTYFPLQIVKKMGEDEFEISSLNPDFLFRYISATKKVCK